METFFASLTGDLNHVYVRYVAESKLAVQQYLERQHTRKGVRTLPWCYIYTEVPVEDAAPVVIESKCGSLYEETLKPSKEVLISDANDSSKPAWTFRFEVTVHADDEAEVIRLGKIDCQNDNGIAEAILQ